MTSSHIVKAACPHDCPDTCAISVTVEGNRAIKVEANRSHNLTNGFLCAKVSKYLERVYHPDRVAYPMRRIGEKGDGKFERISWEVALKEISDKWKFLIAEHGPQCILPYSYGGTIGLLQGQGMDRRFFHRMGASLLDRTICATAGVAGYEATIGNRIGTDAESFSKAKLILIWGSNTLTSNVHLWPQILAASKNGARIITIDPYKTRTAVASHEHLAILPGTDGALALGMMNIILNEGLEDSDYISKYTLGFEDLKKRVIEYSPSRVAEITGLTEKQIVDLSREYATTKPAAIRLNYGLQRHAGGGMAVRNITCLPAIVGAWREEGGGVLLSTSGTFPLNYSALERTDLIPPGTRTINMSTIGEALTNQAKENYSTLDPPILSLYVYNSNPAAVAPDQGQVIKGLLRKDLFTVVHEQFFTDTTDYADIVLPATTQLEHFELMKPYGHLYMMINEPAIPAFAEARSNTDVFRVLASAMEYEDRCLQESDEEMARQVLMSDDPLLEGITLERLSKEGFVRLNVPTPFLPFAEGKFPTQSGKCEFYSKSLADQGLDPLPTYTPPRENRLSNPALYDRYPLALISPPAHNFMNSTFVNQESLLKVEKEPRVEIHPWDAKLRNLETGMHVRVFNDRGEFSLKVKVSERTRPGVAMAPGVWWSKLSPDRKNVNRTTSQTLTDFGNGATFYDNLVDIEKVE